MRFGIHIIGIPQGLFIMQANLWVAFYDPDGDQGRGAVKLTQDLNEALGFASMEEAMQFAMRTSSVMPKRADGKPNRPLTAYTLEIMPLPRQEI